MVLVGNDYIDQLFVWHVDDLYACGITEPKTTFLRLRMAHTLRILLDDRNDNYLAYRVQRRYTSPLWVLVPEPISGNTPRCDLPQIPENVLKYATPVTDEHYPFGTDGYYHKPYRLSEYLEHELGILASRSIRTKEVILFLANKLGGSHARENLRDERGKHALDAETLYLLNKNFRFYGTGAVFSMFDSCSHLLWRALAPLREEVARSLSQRGVRSI